jgi:hypothetical protein
VRSAPPPPSYPGPYPGPYSGPPAGGSGGTAAAGRDQQLAACQAMEVVPYEFATTDAAVTAQQGTKATVTITADVVGGTETEELDLVQEEGAWKVDLAAGEATASASSAGG